MGRINIKKSAVPFAATENSQLVFLDEANNHLKKIDEFGEVTDIESQVQNSRLGDLSNVDTSSENAGETLYYNGANWRTTSDIYVNDDKAVIDINKPLNVPNSVYSPMIKNWAEAPCYLSINESDITVDGGDLIVNGEIRTPKIKSSKSANVDLNLLDNEVKLKSIQNEGVYRGIYDDGLGTVNIKDNISLLDGNNNSFISYTDLHQGANRMRAEFTPNGGSTDFSELNLQAENIEIRNFRSEGTNEKNITFKEDALVLNTNKGTDSTYVFVRPTEVVVDGGTLQVNTEVFVPSVKKAKSAIPSVLFNDDYNVSIGSEDANLAIEDRTSIEGSSTLNIRNGDQYITLEDKTNIGAEKVLKIGNDQTNINVIDETAIGGQSKIEFNTPAVSDGGTGTVNNLLEFDSAGINNTVTHEDGGNYIYSQVQNYYHDTNITVYDLSQPKPSKVSLNAQSVNLSAPQDIQLHDHTKILAKLDVSGDITVNDSVIQYNSCSASGNKAAAFGESTSAGGGYSFAQGYGTQAVGEYSHAEGCNNISFGIASHTEGGVDYDGVSERKNFAFGTNSHAEGSAVRSGLKVFAPTLVMNGLITINSAIDLSSEFGGANYVITDKNAFTPVTSYNFTGSEFHIQLTDTTIQNIEFVVSGEYKPDSEYADKVKGFSTHAEGYGTYAIGDTAHAEGAGTYAMGQSAHAEGGATQALGYCSHAEGVSSVAYLQGMHAKKSGEGLGAGQYCNVTVERSTGDDTVKELNIRGEQPGPENRLLIPSNTVWNFRLLCTGVDASGNTAIYKGEGVIKNVAGVTTLVTSSVTEIADEITVNGLTIAADDTNNSLQLNVQGALSTSIKWSAFVEWNEITFA